MGLWPDQQTEQHHADGLPVPRRYFAAITIWLAISMSVLDAAIANIALPTIAMELHAAPAAAIWVINAYQLATTMLLLPLAAMGDRIGHARVYIGGLALFVIGSLLCALAWDEVSIIVFRIVQGVGGALIMANSGAVIADLYPRDQRGRAYGLTSLGWTIGAVLGVVLGGLIVTYLSWRWIFWINVPTGAAAIAVALRVLRDKGERVPQRLDPLGMTALGLGLFGVLWAITKLANGPFDAATAGYLIGGVVFIGATTDADGYATLLHQDDGRQCPFRRMQFRQQPFQDRERMAMNCQGRESIGDDDDGIEGTRC